MLITFDTFNKSHAVCYSYISYYTAYMKIHYPMVFHKTMLNGNLGTFDEFYELAGLTSDGKDASGAAVVNKTSLEDIKKKMNSKAGKAIENIVITRDKSGVVTVTTTVSGKYKDVFGPLSST